MYEKYKKVLTTEETQQALKRGFNKAAEIVSPTLGVKGRKVVIDKEYGDVEFCDDGITVLAAINLEDTTEQLGVKILREASAKTNDKEGDGTTTTAVLTNELINQIIKDNSGNLSFSSSTDNLKLKHEIEDAVQKVVAYIDEHKKPINTDEDILNIAKISSNDDKVATMLLELFKKLGKDASITTIDGRSIETTHELVEGMSYDQGYISPYFRTESDKEESNLTSPKILVTTDKIQNVDHIKKIIELHSSAKLTDLVIICDDLSGIPLNSLIVGHNSGNLRVVATKAPGFGNQQEYLEDIATVVGATVVGENQAVKFQDLEPEHLGSADSVQCKKDKTTIIGGKGLKENIDSRIAILSARKAEQASDYEKDKLGERISKLSGGVGVIKVGAATETELKTKKAKIIDAVGAVKAAMDDGVIAGGGTALLFASRALTDVGGHAIVKKAIQKPFEQMLANAGLDKKEISTKVLAAEYGFGYDMEDDKFGDMFSLGVIDPSRVVKTALVNATSIALSVLSAAGAITLIRKSEEDNANQDY